MWLYRGCRTLGAAGALDKEPLSGSIEGKECSDLATARSQNRTNEEKWLGETKVDSVPKAYCKLSLP